MPSHAVAFVTGHITTPEQRYTPQGTMIATFSVPVNEREKKGDEWFDAPTTWWRVTTFGNLAQRVVKLDRGTLVTVIGRAKLRPWQAQDGSERTSLEIVASEVQFLARSRTGEDSNGAADEPTTHVDRAGTNDGSPTTLEDLPF